MRGEDAIRQFTDQGYRVVVMGNGSDMEAFKREVEKAMGCTQETILLIEDEKIRVEGGRIVMDGTAASMATVLACLPPPIPAQDYRDYAREERRRTRQDFKHRQKHFRKL